MYLLHARVRIPDRATAMQIRDACVDHCRDVRSRGMTQGRAMHGWQVAADIRLCHWELMLSPPYRQMPGSLQDIVQAVGTRHQGHGAQLQLLEQAKICQLQRQKKLLLTACHVGTRHLVE